MHSSHEIERDRAIYISLQARLDAMDNEARASPEGAELQRKLHELLARLRSYSDDEDG
jgi:vancomycin permeability regulator SanA